VGRAVGACARSIQPWRSSSRTDSSYVLSPRSACPCDGARDDLRDAVERPIPPHGE
jgi:hypothetical protein